MSVLPAVALDPFNFYQNDREGLNIVSQYYVGETFQYGWSEKNRGFFHKRKFDTLVLKVLRMNSMTGIFPSDPAPSTGSRIIEQAIKIGVQPIINLL